MDASGSSYGQQQGSLVTSSHKRHVPNSLQPVHHAGEGYSQARAAHGVAQTCQLPAVTADQLPPQLPGASESLEMSASRQQQHPDNDCPPTARPPKRVFPVALAPAGTSAGAAGPAGSKAKRSRSTAQNKEASGQQQKQGRLAAKAPTSSVGLGPDLALPKAPAAGAGLWPRAANVGQQQHTDVHQGQEYATLTAQGSAGMNADTTTHAAGQPTQRRYTPTSLAQSAMPATAAGQSHISVDHQAAMRAVLDNLALTGDDQTDPPPKALMVSLLPHQRMALAWMLKRELGSSPKGGLLADDQGLGKTITTVAVIVSNMPDPLAAARTANTTQAGSSTLPLVTAAAAAAAAAGGAERSTNQQVARTSKFGMDVAGAVGSRPEENSASLRSGGTLVVCPTSVLHQWHREMADKVNKHTTNFTVHIYHGKDKATSAQQLSRYTVVLTTYGTLAQEAPAKEQRAKQQQRVKQQKAAKAATTGSNSEWPGEDTDVITTNSCWDSNSDSDGDWETYGSNDATEIVDGTMVQQPQDVIKQELALKQEPQLLHDGVKCEVKQERVGCRLPVKSEQIKQEVKGEAVAGSVGVEQQGAADELVRGKHKRSSGPSSAHATGSGLQVAAAAAPETGGLLFQLSWHRVVLDEAQTTKNARTLVAQAAWQLTAKHRWCLSGTPIQNSVDDLFSYFRFLRYAPYDQPALFKALIKNKIAADSDAGYKLLQAVLQGVLLRRTKQSKLPSGEPIIALPPRQQQLAKCDFNTAQEAVFYNQLQEESRRAVEAEHAGGSHSYANMLHSLLRLRQACSHPLLVKGSSVQAQQALAGGVQGKRSSGTLAQQVSAVKKLSTAEQQRLLQAILQLQAQCPVCQDAPDAPLITRCGHVYCADCLGAQLEGAGHADEFTCITCSRVVSNTDVYSAEALQQAMGQPASSQGSAAAATGYSKTGGWVSSTKIDKLLQLLSTIRQRNKDTVSATGPAPGSASVLAVRSKADQALVRTFRSLAARPTAPHRGAAHQPEKVIVFSQWTGMLDLIEHALRLHKHPFRRLDGSMNIAARDQAVSDFQQKQEVNVLLVSLKAAALGLNLTAANHVVLMDLWWNPTQEEQAIDRAHRIGQKRAVEVTRITIKGTVEDRILQLQERKRQLIAAALAEGAGTGVNKLTMEDLKFLFLGDNKQD